MVFRRNDNFKHKSRPANFFFAPVSYKNKNKHNCVTSLDSSNDTGGGRLMHQSSRKINKFKATLQSGLDLKSQLSR
jgi:hypothetical protein